MRILLINQFFYPDLSATAQLLTDLAVELVRRGEQVRVVTSRGGYLGGVGLAAEEEHQGVRIHRVASTPFGRSLPRRLGAYASFFAGAAAEVTRRERPELVIALSTPPLLSLLGGAVGAARRARFIYWVQDLYPDVAVAFGVLPPRGPATRAFEQLSRASLRLADRVVAIGEVMGERLRAKGVDAERLRIIHNWSDSAIGAVANDTNWFLDRHGLRGKFVVQYSGNLGRGHEFGTLLNAAERLRHRTDVAFVVIGDGAKRAEIEGMIRARALTNVTLLPYQRREDLPFSLGASSLSVISLSDGLEGLIVPSKLYGILASGKPSLHFGSTRSEVAQVLAQERCGHAVAHGDVDGAVRRIEELAANPDEAAEMGRRGRAAFLARFERGLAMERWHALCREVLAS
jgi:colanic acid biosynthesis glycosyl transferase WcaI